MGQNLLKMFLSMCNFYNYMKLSLEHFRKKGVKRSLTPSHKETLTLIIEIKSNPYADESAQRSMKIFHPPLIPPIEGGKVGWKFPIEGGKFPSPLVGEG
jgi:hypothetical protein